MFAEFEHDIHQKAQIGEPLTADNLTNIYYDLNKKYFGENITVDEEIGLEWARIPHFYYNYYVYQYATGYSAATSLSRSEEHTSELQSRGHLVCRLLLEKKKKEI